MALWSVFAVRGDDAPEMVLQLGHIGRVTALAFSPDGRILFSAANDGTLKFWNPQTGDLLLATMILSNENDKNGNLATQWISFTPDGFYDGSANV